MKSVQAIQVKIKTKKAEKALLLRCLGLRLRNKDWHGIQETTSNIRETQEHINALEWVLSQDSKKKESVGPIPIRRSDLECENNEWGHGGYILPRKV